MSDLDNVYASFEAALSQDRAVLATIARTTPGVQDPVTGGPGPGTTVSCPCITIMDATSLKTLGFKFGEGLVQTGDIAVLVAMKGVTFDPLPGDVLTLPMGKRKVFGARPTYSGSTAVMTDLLVRA